MTQFGTMCLIGNCADSEYAMVGTEAWQGDELVVGTGNGSVKIAYVEEEHQGTRGWFGWW